MIDWRLEEPARAPPFDRCARAVVRAPAPCRLQPQAINRRAGASSWGARVGRGLQTGARAEPHVVLSCSSGLGVLPDGGAGRGR